VERQAFALDLHQALRHAAGGEAGLRLELGSAAGELLRRRAYHELGFARLRDYCAERLGLSARELETAAQVVAALAQLPTTRAAFSRGELSWTQARLLVAVATPDTEAPWVAAACGQTVRHLEAIIRRHETGTKPEVVRVLAECAEGAAFIDHEPPARFRLACPRWLRLRWRRAVEFARRMTGEDLAIWGAADIIAAEGSSGPSHVWSDEGPVGGTRDDCAPAAANGADDESRPACAAQGDADDAARPLSNPPVDVDPGSRPPWGAHVSGWNASSDGDTASSHTDAFNLDTRLRSVTRALRRVDARLSPLLELMLSLRLYRCLGYSSAGHYLRENLEVSLRKARALVAVERACWRCERFAEAYRAGELSWLRALTVMPIVRRENADAWIERANAVTFRCLNDQVEWALTVRDVTGTHEPVAPPPLGHGLACLHGARTSGVQMRAQRDAATEGLCDGEIAFTGPASVVAFFRATVRGYERPGLPRWTALEALLTHVIAEWERQPRHRDPIFERDGWRCTVPACTARKSLHDHHVKFRSRGGGNEQANRSSSCATHHLRLIHRGHVRSSGTAPAAIRWELGVRPDGPPLLTLLGDTYVND